LIAGSFCLSFLLGNTKRAEIDEGDSPTQINKIEMSSARIGFVLTFFFLFVSRQKERKYVLSKASILKSIPYYFLDKKFDLA
jgi:hypothetical protein